jgi:hypothetical protein
MAILNSPGVEVTVIDQSLYVPGATGTIPLIFVTSAENKTNSSGTGTAPGTLKQNAGQVYLLTSRKDLADTFGTPLFYTDSEGNPINGGEQNEYGLQAAYSLLGVTSRAYVARADVNLSELTQKSSPPTGAVASGTHWVQTTNSLYGINEWNPTTLKFTTKTPLIIDDSNADITSSAGVPNDSFGHAGDYAMYITGATNATGEGIQLWFKTSNSQDAWVTVTQGFDNGKSLTISPHYQYPTYNSGTPVGSVWVKTTTPGLGANWLIKQYNSSSQSFTNVLAPIYDSSVSALFALDQYGGGVNIPVRSIFIESNFNHGTSGDYTADFKIWSRTNSGPTSIVVNTTNNKITTNSTITIRETLANSKNWGDTTTITVIGSTTTSVASQLASAIGASSLVNVRVSYDNVNNKMVISHAQGGDIEIADGTNQPLANAFSNFNPFDPLTKTGIQHLFPAPTGDMYNESDLYDFIITNWAPLVYLAQTDTPSTAPADGTLWYNVVLSADIMVNDGEAWVGYRNVYPDTDPAGPYIGATAPLQQSTGAALVTGDIWMSTANIENYGKYIYVYDASLVVNDPTAGWVLSDVTDSTSPEGWLFADARWATTGGDGLIPMFDQSPIADLLNSNYVDPDAPNPQLYPRGLKLFNTRRSGFNVKKYHRGYIDINANNGQNLAYQNEVMNGPVPYFADRWVTAVANNQDGSGKFGRHAQRGVVVQSLKELVDTNNDLRDTDTLLYTLIACPGYAELIQNMVALNTDISQLAMVVGDTPFRLTPDATTLSHWAENSSLAFDNGDAGATTHDEYLAMFYPSGYTTDNSGNNIVVPPSHMVLRTIINSDNKSYPWFAPAGLRRGVVDNASSVGYIDSQTGEFKTASLYQGIRDVLQDPSGLVNINPIATIPGAGLVLYGQKTRSPVISALDRINVVRLIGYLRRQLAIIAKPYLFEPNDAQTRREIKASMDSFLVNLVNQRALYDFIVVCDTSNNTPARVDRSELWVDIAIEPVKAVEFIYIPLRVLNTGAIASGGK